MQSECSIESIVLPAENETFRAGISLNASQLTKCQFLFAFLSALKSEETLFLLHNHCIKCIKLVYWCVYDTIFGYTLSDF